MNVTPAHPGRIGRPEHSVRDGMMGIVFGPEEQRLELQHMAAGVAELGPVGRDAMLDGLKQARADWIAQGDSTEKHRALKRMDADTRRLESLKGENLTDLSSALIQANNARQQKLGLVVKLGAGLALGGFFLTMPTGHWACLVAGGVGVATALTAQAMSWRTPERDTLSRLATYGAIGQQRSQAADEVKQLVDGLGSKKTHGIRQTETGVQVGGVLLKRRQP